MESEGRWRSHSGLTGNNRYTVEILRQKRPSVRQKSPSDQTAERLKRLYHRLPKVQGKHLTGQGNFLNKFV